MATSERDVGSAFWVHGPERREVHRAGGQSQQEDVKPAIRGSTARGALAVDRRGGSLQRGQGPPSAAWRLWVPSALGNPAARYLMNGYARNRPGATRGKRRGSVAHQPARQGA